MNLDREINDLSAELRMRGSIPCARSGRKVREPECSSQVLAANAEQLLICLACPQGHRLARTSPFQARHLLPLATIAAPAGEQPRKAAPVAKPIRLRGQLKTGIMLDEVSFVHVPKHTVATPTPAVQVAETQAAPTPPLSFQTPCGDEGICGCTCCEIDECEHKPRPLPPRTHGNCANNDDPDSSICAVHNYMSAINPMKCLDWTQKSVAETPAPIVQVEDAHSAPTPTIPQASALDPRLAKLARALRELTSDGRMRVSMLDVMHVLGAANYDEADALILQAGLRTSRLYGPVQAVLVDHHLRSLLEREAASEVRQ